VSDSKKYYYMRLKEDFFDTEELLLLENQPDGEKYSNILLKLYLKSLKNEGKLMYRDRIPYNPWLIATMTRQPVAVVEKALHLFQELELIEVLDNGAIYMMDIQNFIGKTTTEADRKREFRNRIANEKQNIILSGQMSDKSPTNLHQSLEIRDKRLENRYLVLEEPKNNPSKKKNFIGENYYNLVQVIADKYNDRFMYPKGFVLKHSQKMKIGKYLESNYIQSNEIMDLIDRIPSTTESPLAYLFKMIENLIQERRQEEKLKAHKMASDHYKERS